MKSGGIGILTALAFALPLVSAGAEPVPVPAPAAQPPEPSVLEAEAAFAKAMIGGDIPALSRIIAPDWTSGNDSGKLGTRDTFEARLSSGALVITAIHNHDLTVRRAGRVAIVQGMDDETATSEGQDISGPRTWLDVLALRGGRWVLVASHETKLVKPG